jgi:branched-subunit amino acid permease
LYSLKAEKFAIFPGSGAPDSEIQSLPHYKQINLKSKGFSGFAEMLVLVSLIFEIIILASNKNKRLTAMFRLQT